jgi:hypothetical protein
MPRRTRYVVTGVWADGNPTELAEFSTYSAAVAAWKVAKQYRRIPFIGILDLDDPERGYGPWEEEA